MSEVVSRIAICHTCGWRCEENSVKNYAKSQYHAKKNKHLVSVETAKNMKYDYRERQGEKK